MTPYSSIDNNLGSMAKLLPELTTIGVGTGGAEGVAAPPTLRAGGGGNAPNFD